MSEKTVKKVETYSPPKDNYSIKLDANENPQNLFEGFYEEFVSELKNISINRYPCSDSDELRQLIADKFDFVKENVMCGNGSDELIQIIINAFIDRNDNVVIHTPTFTMYKVFTEIAGGSIIEVQPDDDFNVDPEKIIEMANQADAKVIFLCNPNNPTGFAFSRDQITQIIENTQAYVVVDEAYYEFLDETVIDLINDYDRLIVLRTMSKAMALAGARIGYGLACKKTMDSLYRIKPPYNLNVFSQLIGKLYIKNTKNVKGNIDNIIKQRTYLERELKKLTDLKVFNSKGNFILIRTPKTKEILGLSGEAGISIRSYGNTPLLEDCIRVTIGTEDENKRILEVFKKVVGQ